jgi:ketol-acid reductoisomerase
MKSVLARIKDGSWAADFIADQDAGAPATCFQYLMPRAA